MGSCKSNTIVVGDLETTPEDLGQMDWNEAVLACEGLGDGWRLPSKDELNELCEHAGRISNKNISQHSYWSSTEVNGEEAWLVEFSLCFSFPVNKGKTFYVRPVRKIDQ